MPKLKKKSQLQKNKECKDRNKRNRLNTNFRLINNEINKQSQRKRLTNTQSHEIHKNRLRVCQIKRLKNKTSHSIHKSRLKISQKTRLNNTENLNIHKSRLKISQKTRLNNTENLSIHRSRLKSCQKTRLNNAENLSIHRSRLKICQIKRLENLQNLLAHRTRSRISQTKRLENEKEHRKHKIRLKKCQEIRLKNKQNLKVHRARLQISQAKRLSNPTCRQIHCKRQSRSQNLRLSKSHNYTIHKNKSKLVYSNKVLKQRLSELGRKYQNYLKQIKDGPKWKCASCSRLWFRCSVSHYTIDELINKGINKEFILSTCPEMEGNENVGFLCSTCKRHILKSEVPKMSLFHEELKFPYVPEEIKTLTPLEERFICPRIPFMKIQTLSYAGQFSLHGKVVNVPIEVARSVSILPRLAHETDIIPVALKKKKCHKSNYLFSSIRPNVILDAVKVLENSEVYEKCDITIDKERFIHELSEKTHGDTTDGIATVETTNDYDTNSKKKSKNHDDNEYESDFDKEEHEPDNVPCEETMLQPNVLIFAPGEDQVPLSILQDTDAESMSFIKIYGGTLRKIPNHMSYQDWVRSEMTRSDRRCAYVPKLFFSSSKLRIQKIRNSTFFCLRQTKGKPDVTAGMMLDSNCVKNLTLHDCGFKVFATDRGSPAFWEEKKKEVFAMLRQLGPPTFFLTLSAAETKWGELLVILKEIVDNEAITEEEAVSLSFQDKSRLIQSDPVTCSRYFDHRIRKLFALMKSNNSVFDSHKIIDFYIRVEFQHRGSPHVHCLLWLKDAPKLQGSSETTNKEECIQFIDKYISCSSKDLDEDLVDIQTHKHSTTCKKKKSGKVQCRFGIPFFPMPETVLLDPINKDDMNEITMKYHKSNLKSIKNFLEGMYKDKTSIQTFEEFLIKLNISYNHYKIALQFSIKRTTVFIKRLPHDVTLNSYNKDIIKLHRANMDLQYITDMYSCAQYVMNYINKSKRGISKVLLEALEELKAGNFDLQTKLKVLANKFINASEFSAQEAVYFVLAMPLSKNSRATIFINTNIPEKRVSVVKGKKELLQMDESSNDITATNILDHYINRPDDLSDECLATFAANYNFSKKKRLKTKGNVIDPEGEDYIEDEDFENIMSEFKLNNEMGFVYKRSKSKIIRYCKFHRESQKEDYFREQIMLFVPWRNEQRELLNSDNERKYAENFEIIKTNRKVFVFNDEYDFTEDDMTKFKTNDSDQSDDEENTRPNEFAIYDDRTDEGDVIVPSPKKGKDLKHNEYFAIPQLVPVDVYQELMRSLNEKQRKYLLHVLHLLKSGSKPIQECVLGGAGVGKSVLIKALYQCLLRHYISFPGNNIEDLKILLCAPTGKAAFSINGITLHSAFALPLNQTAGEMTPLSHSVRNTLFSKLHALELVIIDEVSMVGSKMFHQIDLRLKEIFQENLPFANKNVILFGDFNQLPPVADKFLFQCDLTNPYGLLAGNPLWEMFHGFKLHEIMRQKDDALFAQALNSLAEGKLNDEQIKMFKSREITDDENLPKDTVHIYRTNNDVTNFNNKVIMLQSNPIEAKANDVVTGEKVSESARQKLLTTVQSLRFQDTQGLPFLIKLSTGIKYMLTSNVDVSDGLFNGAVGELMFIESDEKNDPVRLWFDFFDYSIGKVARRENKHFAISLKINQNFTPIGLITKHIKLRKNAVGTVARNQFPLTPAEAITIYKSQGGTFKNVKVDIKKNLKRNELYVACSRATNLQGLYIRGCFQPPLPPSSHDPVPHAVKNLLDKKPIQFSLFFLQDSEHVLSFMFHNVQSLNAHIEDIKADKNFLAADFLLLVETWTKSNDVYNIPGFSEVIRVDTLKEKRQPNGIAVFCKDNLLKEVKLFQCFNIECAQLTVNIVSFLYDSYCFVVLYKPPTTPYSTFEFELLAMLDAAINTCKSVILIGDFNIDYFKCSNHQMFKNINNLNLKVSVQQNEPSTNLNTQIDLCFSNCENLQTFYYESYYSYHKPIVGVLCSQNLPSQSKKPTQTSIVDASTSSVNLPSFTTGKHKNVKTNSSVVQNDKLAIGFFNNDKVSCYCNAICQILLNQDVILTSILAGEINTQLGKLATQYRSKVNHLNSFPIRQLVDTKKQTNLYTLNIQHDASEFLNDLIDVSPAIEQQVTHILNTKQRCTYCSYEHNESVPNKVFGLKLTSDMNNLHLSQIFSKHINTWSEEGTWICPSCHVDCPKEEMSLISYCGNFLILQLGLWKVIGNRVIKDTSVAITNISKDKLVVNGLNYMISAALFHHGNSVKSGHYTALLKNQSKWIKADDLNIANVNWPRYSKDAYIFLCKRTNL